VTFSPYKIKLAQTLSIQAYLESVRHQGIPNVCPHGLCRDNVPKNPSAILVAMFKRYDELIKMKGLDSAAVWNHAMTIHLELERLNKIDARVQIAKKNAWPVEITFSVLPDRIIRMRRELSKLVFESGFSGDGPVQEAFRTALEESGFGTDIHKFSVNCYPPRNILNLARPG
jgi:hypothetical protein